MVNVYKRLPNGTDFTVYRRAGWCGWNFAVVAGADRYHTEQDNLANLSPRSLQHFALHAHGLLKRLDTLPAEELRALDQSVPATFFDVMGWTMIIYPASWNVWHLALIAVLFGVACFTSPIRVRVTRVALVWLVAVIAIALAYGVGQAVLFGLQRADALPRNFVRMYELVVLLFAVAAMGVIFALGRVARASCQRHEAIAGVVLVWALLGAACCYGFLGGAYLFLWPAMSMVVGWMISQRIHQRWIEERPWLPPVLWCIVPAVIYSPTYVLLAQALGPRSGPLIAAVVAIMLLPTWIGQCESRTAVLSRSSSANVV
jgi:hypothetical protein